MMVLFFIQTRYVIDILERIYMRNYKPIATSLPPNHNLHKIDEASVLPYVASYCSIVRNYNI